MERVDPELLLTQTRWLRALAHGLAQPGSADDLVQETWLAALQSGGGERNPAAWLAGVARNLARRARRSEESRPRRERAAARPEALPATDELVAEGELQRRLIEAVMALEEPQRSTVLLRYFRGLSGEEIARAQGVPSATVRTRLARALARLREALDREWGGREAWSALALGAGSSTVPLTVPLGIGEGLAMGLKTKFVLALALALAGAMAWRVRHAPEGDSARREAAAAAVLDVDSTAALATPPSSPAPPAELGDAREPSLAAPLVAEVLVSGSVLDPDGAPVDEAWVQLEDEQAHMLQAQGSSGSWAVSGLHPGRWSLRASARGFARLRRELVVPGDVAEQREDIVLEPALSLCIQVLDEHGQALVPLEGGLLAVATQDPPRAGTFGVRSDPNELFRAGNLASWSPNPEDSEVPPGCYALLRLDVGLPVHVSLLQRDAIVATELVSEPVEELIMRIDRAELARRLGGVRLRFVDGASGAPAVGRGILQGYSGIGTITGSGGTPTDDAGRVLLEGQPPGLAWLHFVGEGYARSTRCVRVPEGRIEDLGDVPVWPPATLRGRVLDESGESTEALLQWAPRAELRHALDVNALHFSRRGTFELAGVARAPLWLLVSAKGRARQVLAVDASSGLVEGLEIRLGAGTRVVLRHGREGFGRQATIVDASGAPLGSWSLGDQATVALLAPGRYELLVGSGERVERREPFVVGSEPLLLAVPAPER
jgi:RNA polymerase sigma factor (sigma-70 family)